MEEKEDLTTYPPVERVLFVANLMRLLPLLDNLGIESSVDMLEFLEDA